MMGINIALGFSNQFLPFYSFHLILFMQKIFLLFLFFCAVDNLHAQSLSGLVTDSASHEPIINAVVYIPQLKLGSTTDTNGYYNITGIPRGAYDVEVQYVGYANYNRHITISGPTTYNFAITSSSKNFQDVVVTALGNQTTRLRSPVPVIPVTHDMLLQTSASNVIDAISQQPGMSEITTGPGISKPEINGLGFNRVLTLMDGARQEDFQWGDEHGILIDPYAVYNAEIIRGPASLQYGANAVAGVVSFKSEPFAENGTIQGSILNEYQANNGLIGNSVDLGGNHNGLVWDVRGSFEAAHCYWDPKDGYVWGTAFQQSNGRAVIGLNKKWGFSHLTVSVLTRNIGIPDGNRDSATGAFEFDVPLNAKYVNGVYVPGSGQLSPTRSNFFSCNPEIAAAYQTMTHSEVWWQNSINAGAGKIGADIGYTQSVRHEIDTGNVGALNMTIHDIPYSFKYQAEGLNSGLKLTAGINGMYEFMNNFPEVAPPYISDYEIPDYHMFDAGAYAILQKDYKDLTISGGLRYDYRDMAGSSMYLSNYATSAQQQVPAGTPGAYTQFSAFNQSYTGLSGSLGASYQLPGHNYVKLNLAKSFRAPAINELTSNETDPANVFKLGNAGLKPEEGYQADVSYGNNGKDVSFEIDGFYNYISHFIFANRFSNAAGNGDSIRLGAPVYRYTADNAFFTGVSGFLNIHPAAAKWVELDNGFTYIYSFLPGQTDSTQHVPFTPAPRLTTDLKFKLPGKHSSVFKETYLTVGVAKYWAQKDIYSALWNELPSAPYALYHVGIGTNIVNRKTKHVVCSVFLNCNNLFNIAYVDHTSREQYFWSYNGANDPTNFGASPAVVTKQNEGIYNMGRNAAIKLLWSIGGHKTSDAEMHGVQ